MLKSPFFGILLFISASALLVNGAEYTYKEPASCSGVKAKSVDDEPAAPCTAGKHNDDDDDEEVEGRQASSKQDSKWVGGVIPYVINGNFSQCQLDLIKEGMRMIQVQTDSCITFINRTNETYFVNIVNGDGCNTAIGRQSEKKTGLNHKVNLGKAGSYGCFKGHNGVKGLGAATPAHELLHAVGFHHEFTRCDRCKTITVYEKNINSSELNNFHISDSADVVIGSFDTHSIMNYGNKSFSINDNFTMVTLDDSDYLGSANQLTDKDIQKVKTLYQCPGATATTTQCSALGYTCDNIPSDTTTTTTAKTTARAKTTTNRPTRRTLFPFF